MAKPSKAVLEFMEKYRVDSDEIWEVHGSTWVVKHKALERVAAEVGITYDRPSVITCDLANKIACICVFGKLGDRTEWSFGEASPANNKNAYAMAMAEKRAKDRVILKLLTTHGALYSESEADDFVQPRQNPHVTRPADILPATQYDEHGEVIDNIPAPSPDSVKKLTVKDQRPIFVLPQLSTFPRYLFRMLLRLWKILLESFLKTSRARDPLLARSGSLALKGIRPVKKMPVRNVRMATSRFQMRSVM